jgi:hypothetical protein
MTHFIKLTPSQFASHEPFLLTKFDDPYQKGDTVILQETDANSMRTGKERTITLTRVARNEPGIFKGYCILVWETPISNDHETHE